MSIDITSTQTQWGNNRKYMYVHAQSCSGLPLQVAVGVAVGEGGVVVVEQTLLQRPLGQCKGGLVSQHAVIVKHCGGCRQVEREKERERERERERESSLYITSTSQSFHCFAYKTSTGQGCIKNCHWYKCHTVTVGTVSTF